ncbi:UNVERIFIED_CONTAM: hypothetical protein K2H54_053967 [Gekko kuhli]
MSTAEEDLIPVTFRETLVTTGMTIPVTSGAGVFPGEEGLTGLGAIPKYFSGVQARITTRPGGLEWGRFSTDTYETWSLTTLGHWRESRWWPMLSRWHYLPNLQYPEGTNLLHWVGDNRQHLLGEDYRGNPGCHLYH